MRDAQDWIDRWLSNHPMVALAAALGGFLPVLVAIVFHNFGFRVLRVAENFQLAYALVWIPLAIGLAFKTYRRGDSLTWDRLLKTYVLATVGFAGVYYSIYSFRPEAYSFSSGIRHQAEVAKAAGLYRRIKKQYRRCELIARLRLWMAKKDEGEANRLLATRYEFDSPDWQLPDELTVDFCHIAGSMGYIVRDGFCIRGELGSEHQHAQVAQGVDHEHRPGQHQDRYLALPPIELVHSCTSLSGL